MIDQLYNRFIDLVLVPYTSKDAIWIILPLILAVVFAEVYFGRYKLEHLGWNTAFSNSLILIFVSMNLLRFLYDKGILFSYDVRTVLTFALIFIGILLTLFNFFHVFTENIAFILSSAFPINITNFLVVSMVYSSLPIDLLTFSAALIYATLLFSFFKLIWFFIPESFDEDQ